MVRQRTFFVDHRKRKIESKNSGTEKKSRNNEITFPDFKTEKADILSKWENQENIFVRAGDAHRTTKLQIELTNDLVSEQKKVAIITTKLDFFDREKNILSLQNASELSFFPTPEVLLDTKKAEKYVTHRAKLNDQETTFILQIKHRQFLGFRGKNFFDLFFHQQQRWSEVMADEDSPVFQEILKERRHENILILTPNAFFRYRHLDVFQDRLLIIDEAESFANDLLFFPSQTWSPSDLFENPDESVSTAAQFFVAEFGKKLKIRKGSELSAFGEKELLRHDEVFPDITKRIEALLTGIELKKWTQFFTEPNENTARWVNYFPQHGALTFGAWNPKDWRAVQSDLQKWKKYFLSFRMHPPRLIFSACLRRSRPKSLFISNHSSPKN
ncbi:hypothetical protein HC823_00345, partial [Candidatus Gracilibacteria bacterium]|nr:hypothetical protein [Candidatus Gracilibacteria bacterium]